MSQSNTETRRKRDEDDTKTDRTVIGRTTEQNHSIDQAWTIKLTERDGASRIRHIAE